MCGQSIASDAIGSQPVEGGANPTCPLSFYVRRTCRSEAVLWCKRHPHARTVPNSAKHYYCLELDGKFAGLAVWGYGITPTFTANKLLGDSGDIGDYLELCRFFVVDAAPRYSAGRFLALTHRLLRKDAPGVGVLFTYAAGFQGLVGTIYKATGYQYVGRQICNSLVLIDDKLYHRVSLWHRYGTEAATAKAAHKTHHPGARQWCGYNFKYIYWQSTAARKRWGGRFEPQTFPTESDLEIWTVDHLGNRANVDIETAKSISIGKLHTSGAIAGRTTQPVFPQFLGTYGDV